MSAREWFLFNLLMQRKSLIATAAVALRKVHDLDQHFTEDGLASDAWEQVKVELGEQDAQLADATVMLCTLPAPSPRPHSDPRPPAPRSVEVPTNFAR